jgi:putative hydrolase of the HAD superfamily
LLRSLLTEARVPKAGANHTKISAMANLESSGSQGADSLGTQRDVDLGQLRHLVFDLDDTLIDTSGELIPRALDETWHAMSKLGLRVERLELHEFRKNLFHTNPRADFITEAVNHFARSASATHEEIALAGEIAFYKSSDERLRVLSDSAFSKQILIEIAALEKKYHLHLVTAGDPDTQFRKLLWAGLRKDNNTPFSSFLCVDGKDIKIKAEAFRHIMQRWDGPAESFLAIGNRIDIELADAKSIGWKTCWIRHGEYQNLRPQGPLEIPDIELQTLCELSIYLANRPSPAGRVS